MQEGQEQYTPSGQLQNLLDDRAQQAKEAAAPKVPVTTPAPLGPAPAKLDDGTPVVPFDDPVKPVTSFTRSQIAKLSAEGRYSEFKTQILEAQRLGLIEDDLTPEHLRPSNQKREMSAGEKENFDRIYRPILVKNARTEADKLYGAYEDAKAAHEESEKKSWAFDDHERVARAGRVEDARKAWQASEAKVKELKAGEGK